MPNQFFEKHQMFCYAFVDKNIKTLRIPLFLLLSLFLFYFYFTFIFHGESKKYSFKKRKMTKLNCNICSVQYKNETGSIWDQLVHSVICFRFSANLESPWLNFPHNLGSRWRLYNFAGFIRCMFVPTVFSIVQFTVPDFFCNWPDFFCNLRKYSRWRLVIKAVM